MNYDERIEDMDSREPGAIVYYRDRWGRRCKGFVICVVADGRRIVGRLGLANPSFWRLCAAVAGIALVAVLALGLWRFGAGG